MVRRSYDMPDNEPEQMKFEMPSEKEHLLQIVEIFTNQDAGNKFRLDDNTVIAKCEVCGGDEEGRTLLQRCSLDQDWKGFFATRLLLKAIGQDYKGKGLEIDTDFWIGCQFYATVVHNVNNGKTYANISEYNFEKLVEQVARPKSEVKKDMTPEEREKAIKDNVIAWDD